MIGNGAIAIQFVPHLAKIASHLTVFQRSPNWISRKRDKEVTPIQRQRMRRIPFLKHLNRFSTFLAFEARFAMFTRNSPAGWLVARYLTRHINRRVQSPDLQEKLLPDFAVGCKRILLSGEWYKTLQLPNVSLDSSGAAALSGNEVISGDGSRFSADAVIFATGFESTNFLAPIRIRGRQGVDLHHTWEKGAEAYLGMTVAGFPNFFLLYGPNTNLAHNSIIMMIENQTKYILQALVWMDSSQGKALEVRQEMMLSYNQDIDRQDQRTVWVDDCQSWYKNESGKIVNNWPFPSW